MFNEILCIIYFGAKLRFVGHTDDFRQLKLIFSHQIVQSNIKKRAKILCLSK